MTVSVVKPRNHILSETRRFVLQNNDSFASSSHIFLQLRDHEELCNLEIRNLNWERDPKLNNHITMNKYVLSFVRDHMICTVILDYQNNSAKSGTNQGLIKGEC